MKKYIDTNDDSFIGSDGGDKTSTWQHYYMKSLITELNYIMPLFLANAVFLSSTHFAHRRHVMVLERNFGDKSPIQDSSASSNVTTSVSMQTKCNNFFNFVLLTITIQKFLRNMCNWRHCHN